MTASSHHRPDEAAAAAEAPAAGALLEGRVIKAFSGWYRVQAGGREYTCRPRGRLRLDDKGILTGDVVQISPAGTDEGVIEKVAPRHSRLARPPVANVDQVAVVFALTRPPLDRLLIDRITVSAEWEGLGVILVLNKVDLIGGGEIEQVARMYRAAEYPFIAASAREKSGLDDIRRHIAGKVTVLAGPSGVGKSALLNALQPSLGLHTGSVSPRGGRGRHTTRHVRLLPLDVPPAGNGAGDASAPAAPDAGSPGAGTSGGTFVADTPGFSRLDTSSIDKYELAGCFPEMARHRGACRFDNCLHRAEPGCAVKRAVESGLVDEGRYGSYLQMLQEIETAEERRYR